VRFSVLVNNNDMAGPDIWSGPAASAATRIRQCTAMSFAINDQYFEIFYREILPVATAQAQTGKDCRARDTVN